MQYEVAKIQRGNQGQWFSHPAKRFATEADAVQYADQFASKQAGVAGTRIVVKERKGQRLIKEIKV